MTDANPWDGIDMDPEAVAYLHDVGADLPAYSPDAPPGRGKLHPNREMRRAAAAAKGGFEPEGTLYRLTFKDEKYNGLEVVMGGLTIGLFMEIAEMGDLAGDGARARVAREPRKVLRVFEVFAEGLQSWNVTHRGEPVPATLDGIKTQEFPFIMMLLQQWMEAIGGVPAPLEQPSDDTRLSAVASLPMDAL